MQKERPFRALPLLVVVLTFAFLCGAGAAAAAGDPEPPVNITAERMEYFSDRELVVFSGKAVAVRQDVTLAADRMEVTISGGDEGRGENSVRRIVAEGGVQVRQEAPETGKERFATGERGEYDGERKVITLSGKPKLWEGQNVITGTVMTFFIEENRFVVEGGERTPVGLTIFPDKGVQGEK